MSITPHLGIFLCCFGTEVMWFSELHQASCNPLQVRGNHLEVVCL